MVKRKAIEFNFVVMDTDNLKIVKAYENTVILPLNDGYTGERGNAKNPMESILSSLRRAKRSIFDYTIANEWEFWGTLTLDGSKIDRYDLNIISKKLTQYLDNTRRRRINGLKWLLVPEKHKNGAWHFHVLISGLPEEELRDTGKTYGTTERKLYNWLDYEHKFGFNSFVDIRGISLEEHYKIASYLTKYMTKTLGMLCYIGQNKKKYWASKGLKKPDKKRLLFSYDDYQRLLENNTNNIIKQNTYYIKDKETGEILNTVLETIRKK